MHRLVKFRVYQKIRPIIYAVVDKRFKVFFQVISLSILECSVSRR